MSAEAASPPRQRHPDDDGGNGQHPNIDPAAEQIVIGAAMLDAAYIPDIQATGVTPDHFHKPAHADIWKATLDLATGGAPSDPVAVAAELERRGQLGKAGGAPYLFSCLQAVPTAANAPWYAQRLVTLHAKRRVAALGRRLTQLGEAPATDIEDVTDAATAALNEVVAAIEQLDGPPAETQRHPDLDLERMYTQPPAPPELWAGGVLACNRITVIYAPGKTGKSLLAQEIAVALASGAPILGSDSTGVPLNVVYVDQEMTEEDWYERFRSMGLTAADMTLLHERLHVKNLQDWPALDTPEGGRELATVAAYHKADLVIIDTLSKVCAGEENSNDTFQQFYRSTLVPLKRDGRAGLVLDHPGKEVSRGPRGGSAKTDNVDLVWEMLQRGRGVFSLKRTHCRFRHPDEWLYLRRHDSPLGHSIEAADVRAEELIEHCLEVIRGFDPPRKASGRDVMKDVKETGFSVRNETFYEAWRRFRFEKGWAKDE